MGKPKIRYPQFSAHFHHRLVHRFGLEMTGEEKIEFLRQAHVELNLDPPPSKEFENAEFECVVNGVYFVAIYSIPSARFVTALYGTRRRRGHHKFRKKILPKLINKPKEPDAWWTEMQEDMKNARIRRGQKIREGLRKRGG